MKHLLLCKTVLMTPLETIQVCVFKESSSDCILLFLRIATYEFTGYNSHISHGTKAKNTRDDVIVNTENDNVFLNTIKYFSEEAVQARKIFRDAYEKQNSRSLSGQYEPFVDLSNITPEDHAHLEKFFSYQMDQVKENIQRDQSKGPSAHSSNVYPMLPQSPCMMPSAIRELSHLLGRTKQSEESAYSYMTTVLTYYHLVYYAGVFYYQKHCVFQPVSDQELRSIIFPVVEPALAAGKNAKLIGNIIELLRDCPYTKVDRTTENPNRVFFINGVYDLARHELQPPQPTDFVTSYLPFEYNAENIVCPEFDRFLLGLSGGNGTIIALIWEMIGYLLSSDMSAKAFFVLQGVGDSGKSVLGNLISSMFNPEALAHLDIYRFKDKFSTSALRGKRLNVCMDLPRAQISREAIGVIKMLTGDDTITIEQKFKSSESYKPTCKLLFGSNFPLMPADNDPAFRARLVVIPFQYPIPKEKQDKHLLEKLLAERSAIAVKALDAYLRLKARNYRFIQVQGNMCMVTGYIAAPDIMEAFLSECCEFSAEAYTFTADLQETYNRFCEIHCVPPIEDLPTFSRQLNRFCIGRITAKRRRENGQNLNGYQGIRLRIPDNGEGEKAYGHE